MARVNKLIDYFLNKGGKTTLKEEEEDKNHSVLNIYKFIQASFKQINNCVLCQMINGRRNRLCWNYYHFKTDLLW